MVTSSSSSTKRRLLSCKDKENNHNDNSNDNAKKTKMIFDDQMKIRNEVIEAFLKCNLEVPIQIIAKTFNDAIGRLETNKINRNDVEHRKEFYMRLSQHPDRRYTRNRSQTYIFPDLIN
ncbi:unnamed protein product [Adineta steineri]|uniref:Uncharacterized protein n=1 Tax=Adineta steineri TaxID=433720 RepID=A0A816BIU5_9BILA|nr:unnamed protein product [Adineta steineri]CAF1609800.1 unnamed protein product [Adineta steineri]